MSTDNYRNWGRKSNGDVISDLVRPLCTDFRSSPLSSDGKLLTAFKWLEIEGRLETLTEPSMLSSIDYVISVRGVTQCRNHVLIVTYGVKYENNLETSRDRRKMSEELTQYLSQPFDCHCILRFDV